MWMTQKKIIEIVSHSKVWNPVHSIYVSLKCAFFIQKLVDKQSHKMWLWIACATLSCLVHNRHPNFLFVSYLSATGSRVHSNMTTVVEYHFRVCKIR